MGAHHKGAKVGKGHGGPEVPGLDLLGETHEGGRVRAAQGRQHPAAGAWLGVLGTPRCGGAPAEGGGPGLGARSRCPVSVHRGGPGSAESAAANAQAEASAGSGAGPGRAGGAAAAMGLLNFTREPVPEAVSGDMHNLNQLSAEVRGRPGGESEARPWHQARPAPTGLPQLGWVAQGTGPAAAPVRDRSVPQPRHSLCSGCRG